VRGQKKDASSQIFPAKTAVETALACDFNRQIVGRGQEQLVAADGFAAYARKRCIFRCDFG
jgi:hypothetical protein